MLLLIIIALTGAVCSFLYDPSIIVISFISIGILFIINYFYRFGQIQDINKIGLLVEKKKILKEMVDGQLVEFKKYLGDYYPGIEKQIFDSIKPSNLEVYFVNYPEIKSDKVITDLVSLINSKTTKLYNCDIELVKIKCRIKTRLQDSKAWCFPGVVKEFK